MDEIRYFHHHVDNLKFDKDRLSQANAVEKAGNLLACCYKSHQSTPYFSTCFYVRKAGKFFASTLCNSELAIRKSFKGKPLKVSGGGSSNGQNLGQSKFGTSSCKKSKKMAADLTLIFIAVISCLYC